MASYSQAVLDDIRAAVDVVELVGRFVNLRKAGQNYKGLCPFHGEKTPSFVVNPRKGIFHCFGCGVGGDVFGFLMRQDRLSFPEAVRALARQAGVALPDDRGPQPGDSGREELYRVMELAASFYSEALWKRGGEQAREYLDKRRIDRTIAKTFGLGFARFEGKWDLLLEFMRSQGVTADVLVTVGLAVEREAKPGHYDRFRDRLIFPIRDPRGKVVGFGGRAFGETQPKYLNSPETPLYSKGKLLFGADLALSSVREKHRALIVEGYVDCVAAHQYGFTETVAALGTAFTDDQVEILRRNCDEAIVFFDADTAGLKAAERAETLLSNSASSAMFDPAGGGGTWINRSGEFKSRDSLRVRVAVLPSGHDPDTFLQAEGSGAFEERIQQARSIFSYAFERAIEEAAGTSSPRLRSNAFSKVALMLSKVPDHYEAAALSREVSLKLGVDGSQLWIEAQRLQASLRRPSAVMGAATTTPGAGGVERDLVALLLGSREARQILLPLLDQAEVVHAGLREVVETLARVPEAEPEQLMSELGSDAARHALSALIVDERPLADDRVAVEQFRRRLARARTAGRLRSASQAVAEGQQRASSAVPMDATLGLELQAQGAVLHELVGGAVQPLNVPAVESPDPPGSARSPRE